MIWAVRWTASRRPTLSTPEEIYRQVKKNISVQGKGGNYLFAGVHNTAATTPRAHLEAALRAYQDMRGMYAK